MQRESQTLIEADATFAPFIGRFFYFQDYGMRYLLEQSLQYAFSETTVAAFGVDGKMFYVVEVPHVPIADHSDGYAVFQDDIAGEQWMMVGVFPLLGSVTSFLYGKRCQHQVFNERVERFILCVDGFNFNHGQILV